MKNAICGRVDDGPAAGVAAISMGEPELAEGVKSEIIAAGAASGNSEQ